MAVMQNLKEDNTCEELQGFLPSCHSVIKWQSSKEKVKFSTQVPVLLKVIALISEISVLGIGCIKWESFVYSIERFAVLS